MQCVPEIQPKRLPNVNYIFMNKLKNKTTELVDDEEIEDPKFAFKDILLDILEEVLK